MGSATFIEDFKEGLHFTPVEGKPNVYSIGAEPKPNGSVIVEMTNEEWDKFERDIGAAFEHLP